MNRCYGVWEDGRGLSWELDSWLGGGEAIMYNTAMVRVEHLSMLRCWDSLNEVCDSLSHIRAVRKYASCF